MVDQRVPADLAEPRVQRRLAAISIEPLDATAQRLLRNLARGIVISAQPCQGESVQPREEAIEQLPKGPLIAAQYQASGGEIDIGCVAGHYASLALASPFR
jgi:hypothetical protein